jgi:hypothetical protein
MQVVADYFEILSQDMPEGLTEILNKCASISLEASSGRF